MELCPDLAYHQVPKGRSESQKYRFQAMQPCKPLRYPLTPRAKLTDRSWMHPNPSGPCFSPAHLLQYNKGKSHAAGRPSWLSQGGYVW